MYLNAIRYSDDDKNKNNSYNLYSYHTFISAELIGIEFMKIVI